eukprot:g29508.t1
MAIDTAAAEASEDGGNLLLWLLVWSELIVFGILFGGLLVSSVLHADVFAAARLHLSARVAGFSTIVLLVSGWQAALAARSAAKPRLQRLFLLLAAGLGFMFVILKISQYRSEWPHASDEALSPFFELYFLLTGFHLVHVAFVALLFVLVALKPRPSNVGILTTVWHVIDLVWLVMFPLTILATLQDVASRAGCSLATASRALTLNGSVSDTMVRKVLRAAAELGYRHPVSRSKSGRRLVVGVLIPSITNPVFSLSLSGIENRMLMAGHGVLIAQSHYDPARELDAIAALLNEKPTGLILTLCNPDRNIALDMPLPPTVLLHNRPTGHFPSAVTVDNVRAGHELATLLRDLGHERILFVSGSFGASDRARLRYDGYAQAMADTGAKPLPAMQISFVGDYDMLDLSTIMADARPTAIIASNDLLAFGVIGALRREGLSVPRDVSVAGFDGISLGRLMDPPLTTVEMPDTSMGAAAASLLLDMAENAAPPRHLELAHSLRRGGTVRAI